jgi:sulfite reductase (NADPH) flavoprotein alpha-component
MSAHDRPEGAALIPEGAPFTPEQRSWLSGFLAAVLMAPPPAAEAPGDPAGAPAPGPTLASNEEAPWHDPAMALADRMQLADSKPLAPRLMAAMAQQDCGQCGYNCADYANALFNRREKRLNLCAPGGKDTQRMLKALAVEFDSPAEARALAPSIGGNLGAALETMPAPADLGLPGRSRDRPVTAIFRDRRLLNAPGSESRSGASNSILLAPVSTTPSATPLESFRPTISALSTRSLRCSASPMKRRCAGAHCAGRSLRISRWVRRQTPCSSFFR